MGYFNFARFRLGSLFADEWWIRFQCWEFRKYSISIHSTIGISNISLRDKNGFTLEHEFLIDGTLCFKSIISAGLTDFYIVKYNTSGNKQWIRNLGTSICLYIKLVQNLLMRQTFSLPNIFSAQRNLFLQCTVSRLAEPKTQKVRNNYRKS